MSNEEINEVEDSIWGDFDANEVPDDPNYVEPGTYFAVVTEAKYITDKESKERTQMLIKWTIQEPDSQYDGFPITEWKNLPPSKKKLEAENRKPNAAEIRSMSFLKQYLKRTFDFTDAEVPGVKPSDLIGKEAYLTTKATDQEKDGITKTYINVSYTLSPQGYADKQSQQESEIEFQI